MSWCDGHQSVAIGVPIASRNVEMETRMLRIGWFLALTLVAGCQGPTGSPLAEPERFQWCPGGPAVVFSPPGNEWQRSKHNERDVGVAFIRPDVPPGLITVGEIVEICRQDSRPLLRALWDEFEDLSPGEFLRRSHLAGRFANSGYSVEGDALIKRMNGALSRAQFAYRRNQFVEAESHLDRALTYAESIDYGLEDLAEPYLFDPEDHGDPDRFDVAEPVRGSLAGQESLSIHFTMTEERGLHYGRKVYVAHDNRLFVFSYLGPESYVAIFEALLETIAFPDEDQLAPG